MIIDSLNEFADAVSVIQTAGSRFNLGDVIDLSQARDIGNGQTVYLMIQVDTEIITAGSQGSIQFHLVSDAIDTPDTSTATIHMSSPTYVTDDSAANSPELNAGGIIWQVALPLEGDLYERYLGVQYNVTTEDTTAGAVSAFLTLDPRGWKAHPDAVN